MTGPVPEVEVRRSSRRRRTVSARREGERIVVMLPAAFSAAEEATWVEDMVARVLRSEQRSGAGSGRALATDADLLRRAVTLSERWLGGLAEPASVRWVGNQRTRWGSCTPSDRTIRLSDRMRGMPEWVVDYVLVHELAHLLEPGHGPSFWAWVERYPDAEKAKGYLQGWSDASG